MHYGTYSDAKIERCFAKGMLHIFDQQLNIAGARVVVNK